MEKTESLKNKRDAYKKEQAAAYKEKQKEQLEGKLTEKRTNKRTAQQTEKKGSLTYGHKKRSSAELQPLLTLNLIL